MGMMMRRRLVGSIVLVTALVVPPAVSAQADHSARPGSPVAAAALPLGPAGIGETRTTTTLQPGVTLTTIVRGTVDPSHVWTVEVAIPSTSTSPDPDAPAKNLSDRASADALAARLRAAGFDPRVEAVVTPATTDYAGGLLGYRVRVGRFADKAGADALRTQLISAGFTASSVFTGWDGSPSDLGPWRLHVLTVDPRTFEGTLTASFGPDIENRETTSALSRLAGATAAVNAGYFVLDPAAGAPGDPAGIGVYDGRLLSETINNRPALLLRDDARRTDVQRLSWVGIVKARSTRLRLDGIDRKPGLIRNCGGTPDDVPTSLPLHDFTCTDPDELIAFTPEFGATTPAGPGLEAVLDSSERVVSLREPRGGPLPDGYESVQATGSLVGALHAVATIGERLRVVDQLHGEHGQVVKPTFKASIVNGGPELVRDGQIYLTPAADGFVRPLDPSFYYGFSAKRNPRTFAGVDAEGRTLLVAADGRSTASLGLTIVETAQVALALGMVDALNLDGGGSTTVVVGGQVTNAPSDATGERPVGDAVLVLPGRRG